MADLPVFGTSTPIQPDIGIGGAFGAGVKRGVLEPLSFIRGRPEIDERIDSSAEKVSEFLGSMVGLGISFVPFAAGTGLVLKGIGLTAPLRAASAIAIEGGTVRYPLYNFVRNTIAGGLQFAGTSEESEDIPKNLVIGATLGGVVEGFFLSRAMRARSSPGAVRPDGTLSPDQAAKELSLTPVEGASSERVSTSIQNLAREDLTLEKMLAELSSEHVETLRIPQVSNVQDLVNHARTRLPGAQILTRNRNEVLIHNPVDPLDKLNPRQIDQWQKGGVFDGMEVIYGGKSGTYVSTGVVEGIPADRVQIRRVDRPGATFAPLRSEVTFPIETRNLTPNVQRRRALEVAAQVAQTRVGFVVPSRNPDFVRRGFVDTVEFESANSMQQFTARHAESMRMTPDLVGDTAEEILEDFARKRQIPGVVIRDADSGLISEVRVFDQSKVSYVQEPPRVGVDVDGAAIAITPEGDVILNSFIPSWKNSIIPALRDQGIPEKEIQKFLDLHAEQMGKRLNDLLDPETRSLIEAGNRQFFDGCM